MCGVSNVPPTSVKARLFSIAETASVLATRQDAFCSVSPFVSGVASRFADSCVFPPPPLSSVLQGGPGGLLCGLLVPHGAQHTLRLYGKNTYSGEYESERARVSE